MKKLLVMICIVALMLTCAACSKEPTYSDGPGESESPTSPTYEVKDPQKENALPTDDLSLAAINTGKLSNYRVAVGYTSTTENIVTIILHDGKDQQTRNIIVNTVHPDGTASMQKQEFVRYVWSENAKYTNEQTEPAAHTFATSAVDTTLSTTIDEMVCEGFYAAIEERIASSVYDVIKDHYKLDSIELSQNGETWSFNDVFVTIASDRIESIHCTNGTQTIVIEVTGVNDVNFGGTE